MVGFKARTSDEDFKLGLIMLDHWPSYLLQPADITG